MVMESANASERLDRYLSKKQQDNLAKCLDVIVKSRFGQVILYYDNGVLKFMAPAPSLSANGTWLLDLMMEG